MQQSHTLRPVQMGRTLVGSALLILGALFLLNQVTSVDAAGIVSAWWPIAIIAAGLMQFATNPKARVGSGIAITVGALLLLASLNILPISASTLFFPLVLVAVGAFLVLTRSGRPVDSEFEETIASVVLFGTNDVVSRSQWFRGGWLAAIFGGATLDLRSAQLGPNGATLDAVAIFGGADILVPHGWKVTGSGLPIFGGYEDETKTDEPPPMDAPTLKVNAIALFGGISVKHNE